MYGGPKFYGKKSTTAQCPLVNGAHCELAIVFFSWHFRATVVTSPGLGRKPGVGEVDDGGNDTAHRVTGPNVSSPSVVYSFCCMRVEAKEEEEADGLMEKLRIELFHFQRTRCPIKTIFQTRAHFDRSDSFVFATFDPCQS